MRKTEIKKIEIKRLSKKFLRFFLFSIFYFLFSIPCLYASAFDNIGVGARVKGMGDTFVAVSDDINSIYWNPAGLGKITEKQFTLMHRDLFGLGLINYNFVGYVQPNIGKGVIGFGWIRLGTTQDVSFLDYNENTFIFSYSKSFLLQKLFFGANIKYYSVNYNWEFEGYKRASGYGFDLGIKYMDLFDKFTLATMVQDLNKGKIRWDTGTSEEMLLNWKSGLAYYFNKKVVLGFDIDSLSRTNEMKFSKIHLGFEYWFIKNVTGFRGGLFTVSENKLNYTLGVSFGVSKFRLDYGYELHPDLGGSHLFSLNINFGKPR